MGEDFEQSKKYHSQLMAEQRMKLENSQQQLISSTRQ